MSGHEPFGQVVITARDIYDALVALKSSVERLADGADATAKSVTDHEQRLRAVEDVRPGPRIRDMEERLRLVEGRLWPLPTVSVLIALTALAVGIIPRLGGS